MLKLFASATLAVESRCEDRLAYIIIYEGQNTLRPGLWYECVCMGYPGCMGHMVGGEQDMFLHSLCRLVPRPE